MQGLSTGVKRINFGVDSLALGIKSSISAIMSLTAENPSSPVEASTGGGIFCVNFNQDYTSLGLGTKKGYKLFTITSEDKIEEICDNANEDTCIVERLFSSSLVAVVSLSSPRKLKVCHFKKHSEICNYSYPNTILAVKLNRAIIMCKFRPNNERTKELNCMMRLIVCLEESLYIHNIRDMKVLHTIRDTPPNPSGLCALSISNDNCYLAYPGSNTIGQVQIFDALNLQSKTMIPAHDSPLAALAFNEAGTKIATASEKGTVIRVFNVADGARLHELRRGMKRCAHIYSLSFSSNSLFLLCSSNTETVHVFKLEEVNNTQPVVTEEQPGLMGWMTKAVSASASYLPAPVTDMLSQGRAFATVTLPFQGIRNTVAISTIQKQQRIAVASADGFLYIYNFNTAEGGECALLKQHRLFGGTDSAGGSSDVVSVPQSSGYPGAARKTEPADRGGGGSYARVVKGIASSAQLTEAEKMNEMAAACESPPRDTLKLDDEDEYPPM